MADTSPSSDPLYVGWMTGYMHAECAHLFFHNGAISKETDRHRLLRAIFTYQTLVETLQPSDQAEISKGLKTMVAEVAEAKLNIGTVQEEDFDRWHDSVMGTLRAKIPSAYHAAGFASTVSDLCTPPKTAGWIRHALNHTLTQDHLPKIGRAISNDAHDVIASDCVRLAGWVDEDPVVGPERVGKALRAQVREQWTDLVLGQKSAPDLLSGGSQAWLWILGALLAIGIGLGIAAIVALPFFVVLWIAKVNLANITLSSTNNVLSTVQTFLGILTAVGVTLGFVLKKAYQGFEAAFSWIGVRLAGLRSLERNQGPGKARAVKTQQPEVPAEPSLPVAPT